MADNKSRKELIEIREMDDLTKSIGRNMDNLAEKSDRHLDILTNSTDMMKKIVGEIEDSESLGKAINALKEKEKELTKANFGLNEDLKNELLNQVTAAKEALSIEQKRRDIVDQVAKKAEDFGSAMTEQLDSLKSSLAEIPIVGKILNNIIPYDTINKKIGETTAAFTDKFSDAFTDNLKAGKGFTSSFAGGMTEGLGAAGEMIGPLLTNPYTAAALAILAVTAIGVIGFYKLTEAAKKFRQETGLLNSQTKGLEQQIGRVYSATAPLGASMDDVASAATAFAKQLSPTEQVSDAVLQNMVVLNKNFGISVDTAAELNKTFQNIGGLNQEQAQYLIAQTVAMARIAKVAPAAVLKDMAESSEYAYKYFNGSPEKLALAAVQAQKLGTSIKQAGEVADHLLDFQSSITDELSASAILGTNINLGQARYLAANGKILEAQQATVDAVQNIGDITNLNIQEQEALAKATGMSIPELTNQIRIREQFGKLNEADLAAAKALQASGVDITKVSKEQLALKSAEMAKQQEMQSQFDTMANQLSAQFSQIMMALTPMGTLLMGILKPIMSLVIGFFKPIGAALSHIMDAVQKLMVPFKDMFGDGAGIAGAFELIGNILSLTITPIIEFAAATINAIADIIGGIYKIVKGIFTLDFGLIMEGLGQGLKGIGEYILRIPIMLFNALIDIFPTLGTALSDFFSSIGSKIKAMFIDILPDWAKRFIGGASGDDSLAASQQMQTEPTESINDGVIQNGKVISTNPADTLFATKDPGSLLGGLGGLLEGIGNKAGSVAGAFNGSNRIIEKLDELIAATAGSRDVYMDKEKVTNVVATTNEKSGKNRFGLMGA